MSALLKKIFSKFFPALLCGVFVGGACGPGQAFQSLVGDEVLVTARISAKALALQQGKFSEAVEAQKKAVQMTQSRYGALHPALAPVLEDLASLYRYEADYAKAEEQLKWGLAIREKSLGPEDPLVADSLDGLASLYQETGRFIEAELFEKRALGIREKGPTEAWAKTLGFLSEAQLALGKTDPAEASAGKALELLKKKKDSDPGLWIELLRQSALVDQALGKFPEAEVSLLKALDIAHKNFPSDSVEVGDALERLGDFYRSQNHTDKAKPLYDSALEIDQHFVGVNEAYPAISSIQRLARISQSAGDFQGSETLWGRALSVNQKIFGPKHPQVALDLAGLALAEQSLGEKEKASKDLRQSVEILKSFLPEGHPLVSRLQKRLQTLSH